MLYDIATSRQAELLANTRKIEMRAAYEQLSRIERLQRSVRTARARLGLLPVAS
jgi:hypothetical protein